MDKDPETESAFWVPHSETTNWLTVVYYGVETLTLHLYLQQA